MVARGRAPGDIGPRAASAWGVAAARTRPGLRPTCWPRTARSALSAHRVGRAAAPSGAARGSGLRPRTLGDWVDSCRGPPDLLRRVVVGTPAPALLRFHGHLSNIERALGCFSRGCSAGSLASSKPGATMMFHKMVAAAREVVCMWLRSVAIRLLGLEPLSICLDDTSKHKTASLSRLNTSAVALLAPMMLIDYYGNKIWTPPLHYSHLHLSISTT